MHKARRARPPFLLTAKAVLLGSPTYHSLDGKCRLAERLIPSFPSCECYVEVFADGAKLNFLRSQSAPVEVLNDINGDLMTLHQTYQNLAPPIFLWAAIKS